VNVELQINNSSDVKARFVTWAPSPCRVRVTNPAGAAGPAVSVRLAGVSAAGGGDGGAQPGQARLAEGSVPRCAGRVRVIPR